MSAKRWSSVDGCVSRTVTVPCDVPLEQTVFVTWGDLCQVRITDVSPAESVDLEDPIVTRWLARSDDLTAQVEVGSADTRLDRDLQRCLMTLCVGDTAQVTLCDTSGHAQLTCHMTLVTRQEPAGERLSRCEPTRLIELAERYRIRGNELYRQKRVQDAYLQYRQALQLLLYCHRPKQLDETQRQLVAAMLDTCRANIAACHSFASRPLEALQSASRVLLNQPDHAKCLYRRAAAALQLQRLTTAADDIAQLLKLEPDSRAAGQLQLQLSRQQLEHDSRTAQYMHKYISGAP